MPSIDLKLDGDHAWPDLAGLFDRDRVISLMGPDAPPWRMAMLRGGMASGRRSVTLRIDLPEGRTLLTETSLECLTAAVRAMNAAPVQADEVHDR